MIRKYHNHKPQTTPWHREEEPLNHHETPGRQIKQSNQLSLPHQHDCNQNYNCCSSIKHMSRDMRFPTMWYVRPAKPQISLKGGCTGSSESILVKISHWWKSHVAAHIPLYKLPTH